MYVHDDGGHGTLFQMMYIQTKLAQGMLHKNESVCLVLSWMNRILRKQFLDSF